MTTLEVELSELHYKALCRLADREHATPEELASRIILAAIEQAENFEMRAARASREKFVAALDKVPDVPVVPPDELVD